MGCLLTLSAPADRRLPPKTLIGSLRKELDVQPKAATSARAVNSGAALAGALVGAVVLSGCLGGFPLGPPAREFTDQTLEINITPLLTEVPYTLSMAVLFTRESPYHRTNYEVAGVVNALHVTSGAATFILVNHTVDTAYLEISGVGAVRLWGETHLELPTIEGTESYLQNQWTRPAELENITGGPPRAGQLLLVNGSTSHTAAFPLNLTVVYRGESRLCSMDSSFAGDLAARPVSTAEWTFLEGMGGGGMCA